jgi:hypothetical protein
VNQCDTNLSFLSWPLYTSVGPARISAWTPTALFTSLLIFLSPSRRIPDYTTTTSFVVLSLSQHSTQDNLCTECCRAASYFEFRVQIPALLVQVSEVYVSSPRKLLRPNLTLGPYDCPPLRLHFTIRCCIIYAIGGSSLNNT